MKTNLSEESSYIDEAMVTNASNFHGDNVSATYFESLLAGLIGLNKELDKVKASLFYGKGNTPSSHVPLSFLGCRDLPLNFESERIGEDTIHAIIGIATEAGELLELLYSTLYEGKKFDKTNLKEEVGDIFWFSAVLSNAHKMTFEEIQAANIKKLRQRYPNAFTEHDALNRNLKKERKVLEKTLDG